jgi:chromosome segregation ATPase
MGSDRSALRRSAEELRSDAARLEPERSELEKRLEKNEQPLAAAATHDDAARADLEATRKAQGDATAGHRHRRAELEAEAAKQTRARVDATNEIARRLVTLGTLLNLNRVAAPDLDVLYTRVDGLRTSIGAREREIDRLRVEASRSDPRAVSRGAAVIIGAVVILIALVCLLIALR